MGGWEKKRGKIWGEKSSFKKKRKTLGGENPERKGGKKRKGPKPFGGF